ncbi:MAG: hemolysin III family protein [Eubacteriales bacterium]|nr:hemolysin III family protein [Eubacteriales bacterium]
MLERKDTINNQCLGEEIANSVSHGIGTLLSVAGLVIAVVYAAMYGDAMSVVSASLYGASLVILYASSTIYHSLANNMAKRVFRILDHCNIFVLILGTYIPICLSVLRGPLGWTYFGILTGCAATGIVFNAIDLHRWSKISVVLYLAMGWIIVFTFNKLIAALPPESIKTSLGLLIGGGLAYSLGVIFFALGKYKYMHYIWHMFVVAGSILHYFFVLFYALPVR